MVNVGDNLIQLGVDRKRLAKRTGLSLARVEEIFNGAGVTARELRVIANFLHLPADVLIRSQASIGKSDVRYRKTPRKAALTAEVRIIEIASFLSRNNLLTRGLNKQWRVSADLNDRPSIEKAAALVRQRLCRSEERLDPLLNLVERADHAGIASCLVLHDLGVEGAALQLSGVGLIAIAARSFAPRMLFSCAHELAHIVLGHTDAGRVLIDDDTIEAFDSDSEEERLCNTLASALLQPAEGVARLLEAARKRFKIPDDSISAAEVLLVAGYFGTSFFAAAMRLEHLGIAPSGTAASFEKAIKSDHKSLANYAREADLPPREAIHIPIISPTLRRAMAHKIGEGDMSLGRASDILGYSITEMNDALA